MKTNYLSAMALIGLLAFSSCSKDDATTDNKTETPKSTIVLTEDQNVGTTTNFAQNVNLVAEFDNLLKSTSLLKGMATTATGPEICGQKPAGVLNPTTASYDFNLGYRVLKSNNTNALVRNGGWNINISKTGFINEAGRCVVMHTTLNNRPAVVVLLGADSSAARTNDATRLMNWASQLPKRI